MNTQGTYAGRRDLVAEYLGQYKRYTEAVNSGRDELAVKIWQGIEKLHKNFDIELVRADSQSSERGQ